MSDQYTIDDFKKGDFVELHNDTSKERWFGRITAINKKREDPLSVHYLKKIGGRKWPNLPEDLDYYTWWEIQTGDRQKAEYWTEIDCVIQVGKLFRPVKLDPGLDVPTKTLYLLTLEAKDRAVEDSPSEEEEVNPFRAVIEQQNALKSYPRERVWGKKKTKTKLKSEDLGTKPDPRRGLKDFPGEFYDDEPCLKCGATDRPDDFILCDGDGCGRGGHFDCFGLEAVPAGEWFCPDCTTAKEKTKGVVEQRKQVEAACEELVGKKVLGTLGSQAILETPTGPESEVIGTLGSQEETPTGPESEDEGQEERFEMRRVTDHDWEKVHAAVMPPPPMPPPPPKKRPATTPLRRSDRQAGTPVKEMTSPEPQEYTEEKYQVYNQRLWDNDKLDTDLYKPFEHPDPKLRHPCLYVCDVPRPPNKGTQVDHYYRRYDVDGNLQEFLDCDGNGYYKRGENQKHLRSLEALTRHMEKFLFPEEEA